MDEYREIEGSRGKRRGKDKTLRYAILAYLIITTTILGLYKHNEIKYLYHKYILGKNITIYNHRIVRESDLVERKQIKSPSRQEIENEIAIRIENERRYNYENQKRIAELDKSMAELEQKRLRNNNQIECRMNSDGKKIYTNIILTENNLIPCQ